MHSTRILKRLQSLVYAVIILTGLAVGAVRLLLPMIADYKTQAVEYLSATLGAQISLERLEAKLVGFTPQLLLTDVEIILPDNATPLHLDELRLSINLIDSLRYGTLRVGWLLISGAQLVINMNPNTGPALEFWTTSGTHTVSLTPLLSQGPLLLEDSAITIHRPDAPPLDIKPVTAKLISKGSDLLYIGLETSLGAQNAIQIEAEINTRQGLDGQLHFKTTNFILNSWFTSWLPKNWVLNAVVDAELWVHWNGTQLEINGPITLNDVLFSTAGPAQSVATKFTTRLGLKQQQSNWQGWLTHITWEQAAHSIEEAELGISWPATAAAGVPRVRFAIADTQLRVLSDLANSLPVPKVLREALVGLDLQGQVQDLRLDITIPTTGIANWEAAGQLSDFANQAWHTLPGITGLDLAFYANSTGGKASIKALGTKIHVPKVFRAPLPPLDLDADLSWIMAANGAIEVNVPNLIAENPDFGTTTRLAMLFSNNASTPFLDLQTHFSYGDVAAVHHYLPVGAMKKPLIDWLDQALVAGRIQQGRVVLRGLADDFPFRKQEGRFEAILDLEQVVLNYEAQWPRLESAAGQLSFIGPGLVIDLKRGAVMNSTVQQAHAVVKDIKPATHLPITGQVTGPFTDVLATLRGPMATTHGHYVKGMQVDGASTIAITVGIPIEPGATFKIDGQIYWQGAGLILDDWGLNLRDINGNLRFTDQGLFAEVITADLDGEPLSLNVDTPASDPGESAATYLDVELPLSTKTLNTLVPGWPWELVTGSAPGLLTLAIRHQEPSESTSAINYYLRSNLKGLGIILPDPLGKTEDAVQNLALDGVLPLSTDHLLTINYGRIKAVLHMGAMPSSSTTPRIIAGTVLSNDLGKLNPNRSGLNIGGSIKRLDVASWLTWLEHNATKFPSPPTSPARLKNHTPVLPAIKANLHIDELVLVQTIKNLDLTVVQSNHGWNLAVKSPQITGNLLIPHKMRVKPLQARFKHIKIDLPAETATVVATSTYQEDGIAQDTIDPRQAPILELQIDNLQLGNQPLGTLVINTKPTTEGVAITKLVLDGPLTITGNGNWIGTKHIQETSLYLQVKNSDLGTTLRSIGFNSGLQQAGVDVKAELHWNSPPYDLDLEQLTGDVTLHMGKGRVADVSPGIGRLFGLLNLETILRRLTLDFSDLFNAGFAFDRIDGSFVLGNGDATVRGLKVNGPAANLTVSGRIGLVAKDYDQIITVIPAISSTMPVAGAFAGGPITAAALLVADRLVGEHVNQLARLQYHITGPWKAPSMVRIQTQDGWSFSNLLVPPQTE